WPQRRQQLRVAHWQKAATFSPIARRVCPIAFLGKHDYRTFHQLAASIRQVAEPEFGTWQINKNSYRLIALLRRMADSLNACRMLGMIAVRCVYARNIHAAFDQALDYARCIRGRTQRAYDLRPGPARHGDYIH